MTKKQRAVALIPYLRQSKRHDGPLSLNGQREAIRKWADVNGVDLLPEVPERGVSGSKSWRERDLGVAFARVESGEAGGIICAYQSRLTREPGSAVHEFLEAFERLDGARLVCAKENLDMRGGNPAQSFMFRTWANMARFEWEMRREGFREARRGSVAKGTHPSSHMPAGYGQAETGRLNGNGNPARGGLVPNGDAPAIRALFELKAAGGSWSEAVRLLDEAGVPNRSGGRWVHGSAAAIVRNPVYMGQARHGEFVNPDAHQAIVSESLWRRAQPGTRGPRQSEGALLSGGILRCASCGRAMTPSTDGRYRCRPQQIAGPPCEAPASVKAEDADRIVTARLYADEAAKEAPPAPDLEPFRTAVATAGNRYASLLATDLLDIDPAAFSAKAAELKTAREEAEDALAEAESAETRVAVAWDGMTIPEKRRWLAGSGVTVLVERGREPASERMTFVDRDPKVFGAEWKAAWRSDAGLT